MVDSYGSIKKKKLINIIIYMMIIIWWSLYSVGVIVWDDVPVLGAYPIFFNERRVYSSLSLSGTPMISKTVFTFTKNTAFVGIHCLQL